MSVIWPLWSSHEAVRCAVCDGPTEHTEESGYPKGFGQFRRACVTGHSWTYYDLAAPAEVEP